VNDNDIQMILTLISHYKIENNRKKAGKIFCEINDNLKKIQLQHYDKIDSILEHINTNIDKCFAKAKERLASNNG
jgi:hypothetical protein